MSHIVVTRHGPWAHIRIDRAEKRNALNQAARRDLQEALASLAGVASAVVITGSDQWFCCGADIKERAQWIAEGKPDTAGPEGIELAMAIRHFPGVVIAAVNGLALGYGFNLINCSDLALAADHAQFGLPELRSGSFASLSAATGRLSGLNDKRLGWLVFNTDPIDARTAASWGLVNEVVPADQLAERATALAEKIAQFDAGAIAATKVALAELSGRDHDWRRDMEFGQTIGARIRQLVGAGK
ncbi:MAG TPA: enoyl-CoA hydratase/isomerase family protein [Pararobbsia sp.]|nr:enoyl-CoA hydratase/isomerase family protein [Pararobbsia sp.]